MEKNEILKKVREILCDTLGIDENEIKEDSTINSLGADSLDAVEVSMECEKQFGITIEDKEFEKIEKIDDLAELVEKKLKAKK